jgi:hypothetical protein
MNITCIGDMMKMNPFFGPSSIQAPKKKGEVRRFVWNSAQLSTYKASIELLNGTIPIERAERIGSRTDRTCKALQALTQPNN